MNILFIVWNFYPNTAYTNRTKATVRGFKECNCNCDILSIKPLITKEEMCLNHDDGNTRSFFSTFLGMIRNYILLQRKAIQYDVIYCTVGDYRILKKCVSLARRYGKVAVHERTEFPDIFYKKTPRAQRMLKAYLQEVTKFDHLFVISNPIKNYFIENGMPEQRISIYPMIVDPNRFANMQKHNVGYRYIAYCGNLSNSKDGVADLIESYGLSVTKKTHKMMLIGSIPSKSEMTIYRDLIEKYGIKDKVIFRGNVERDEMPQILVNADLLVLCRPDNRQALGGFPTKLGEYLSTGNPVLVTRVGDIEKYIIDGTNGYLSAPNDIAAFSKKIDIIFSDYEKAKQVGEKGKELALNEFNYSEQIKRVVKTLKKLI